MAGGRVFCKWKDTGCRRSTAYLGQAEDSMAHFVKELKCW
jgi:hypothetical protein